MFGRKRKFYCEHYTQELYKETEHLTPLENIIEDKLNSTIPTKPEDMDEYFDWNSI